MIYRLLLTLCFLVFAAPIEMAESRGQAVYDTTAVSEQTEPESAVITVDEQPENSEKAPSDADVSSESDESQNDLGDDVQSDLAQIKELISFSKVFYSLILLFVTYFINKYLTIIIDSTSEKATHYRLFIKRLAPISRILIWSFAIYIVIAGIIVPPFETVITIAASIGIAVGFASQDILRNIFGGVMIILDRPFQVGDKIQVGDHYGEVLSIGLRSSRVVTPDDSVVSLPNGELMNRAVSNANSSALDCQVVAEIYLPATVDIQQVKQIAFKAVYASSFTYLNKPVDVIVLNEMHNRQYVIKLRVKAYVVDIRYEFLFKSDMTEMILNECNRLGYIPRNGLEQIPVAE
jgi:small-conductance mechanosensitive channel